MIAAPYAHRPTVAQTMPPRPLEVVDCVVDVVDGVDEGVNACVEKEVGDTDDAVVDDIGGDGGFEFVSDTLAIVGRILGRMDEVVVWIVVVVDVGDVSNSGFDIEGEEFVV